MRPGLALLLLAAAAPGVAAPTFDYGSIELEAAGEYQVGDHDLGPGYLRLIATGEMSFTDQLTAKAVVAPCAGRYAEQPQGVTECSPYRLVEQLTLDGVGDNYDFSIGRQVITVGNTEGFVLLDRFNGRDYCRFARLITDNKLPNDFVRGRAFFGDMTVSLTYAPLSATSELPDPDSYCADRYDDPDGIVGLLPDPDANDLASDWAGGAEIALNQGSWSATLNVISSLDDLFVLRTYPAPEKTRPRTLWLGGTASATIGGVVVRSELAYAPEADFTLAPASTYRLLAKGIATDGVDSRWNLLLSLGLEIRKGDWFMAFQYYQNQVEGGARLIRDTQLQMLSLRLRGSFSNDRVSVSAFTVHDLNTQDLGLNAVIGYEIDMHTAIELGAALYADFGSETGLFGSYAGRESVYTHIRYAF